MKPDATPQRGTDVDDQAGFGVLMNAASVGVEAAVRAFVLGDGALMRRHLAEVDAGVKWLRAAAAEDGL